MPEVGPGQDKLQGDPKNRIAVRPPSIDIQFPLDCTFALAERAHSTAAHPSVSSAQGSDMTSKCAFSLSGKAWPDRAVAAMDWTVGRASDGERMRTGGEEGGGAYDVDVLFTVRGRRGGERKGGRAEAWRRDSERDLGADWPTVALAHTKLAMDDRRLKFRGG